MPIETELTGAEHAIMRCCNTLKLESKLNDDLDITAVLTYIKGDKQARYELSYGAQEMLYGRWHKETALTPFDVMGYRYCRGMEYPRNVQWSDLELFTRYAMLKLVDGEDGWQLQQIHYECDMFCGDSEPEVIYKRE